MRLSICRPVFFPLTLLLVLFSMADIAFGQTQKSDSLRLVVVNTKDPVRRLAAMIQYFDYWHSIQRDTLYNYAGEALVMARKYGNRTLEAKASIALSRSYIHWGWLDSARGCIAPFLEPSSVSKLPPEVIATVRRQMGLVYGSGSKNKEALALLYENSSFCQRHQDWENYAATANNIASIFLGNKEMDAAKPWLDLSLDYATENTARMQLIRAATFANLIVYHTHKANFKEAEKNYDSASLILQRHENILLQALLLRNRAQMLMYAGKIEAAETSMRDMYRIRNKVSESDNNIEDNLQLAHLYDKAGLLEKAIKICEQGIKEGSLYDTMSPVLMVNNDIKNRMPYYEMLVHLYKRNNQPDKQLQAMEWLVVAKDSFYTYNKAEAMAELEAKYRLSEQERLLAEQRLVLVKKDYTIWGGIGLSAFTLTTIAISFIRYRRRQKASMEQALAEEKRLAAKATREAAEAERKRIAADLHDNLGAYGAAIKSNLYQLQEGKTSREHLMAQMGENVQTMVDELGNTIWVLNKSNQPITSIYDKLKTWTRKLLSNYPDIRCLFEEDVSNEPILSPAQALQWLYIMQEAINNAVKHSGSHLIEVNLTVSNTHWETTVLDGGVGNQAQWIRDGHGISSIESRCKKMGWLCKWQDAQPKGTLFTFKMNGAA